MGFKKNLFCFLFKKTKKYEIRKKKVVFLIVSESRPGVTRLSLTSCGERERAPCRLSGCPAPRAVFLYILPFFLLVRESRVVKWLRVKWLQTGGTVSKCGRIPNAWTKVELGESLIMDKIFGNEIRLKTTSGKIIRQKCFLQNIYYDSFVRQIPFVDSVVPCSRRILPRCWLQRRWWYIKMVLLSVDRATCLIYFLCSWRVTLHDANGTIII